MNDNKKTEILAPAGSQQQLQAAVRSGADAIYLGLSSFNARQNAKNFDDEALLDAVKYAHERNVKVYVTLNTLIEEDEIKSMEQVIQTAAEAQVDALIVQDFAVAKAAKRLYPDLPLFASTQMAVHNSAGAQTLKEFGFRRIVLARELSLVEIRKLATEVDIEFEVFVHGAHCMSVSGNCYLSSMIGGRSGNRGLCAQPCRLNFSTEARDYALSLKDLSSISHLKELQDAGVYSFKIEGRMKRPEYVAEAVKACKAALEGSLVDIKSLKDVFSRSGFTDGYLTGKRNLSMFGHRTREDVHASLRVVDDIAKTYKDEKQDVLIDAFLKVQADTPAELSVSDGTYKVTVSGDIPEVALKVQLGIEQAEKSIRKTGGTPFCIQKFSAVIEEGLALSSAQLNSLRRNALEELSQKRGRSTMWERHFVAAEKLPVYTPSPQREVRLRFERENQIFPEAKQKTIILPISEIEKSLDLIEDMGDSLIGEISALIFPDNQEAEIKRLRKLYALGLRHVLCDNIGALKISKEIGFELHGGPSLNVINSQALSFFESLNLLDMTLSIEISFPKVRKMKGSLKRGVVGYGYLPLMKMRACPVQGEHGCEQCSGLGALTDRKGEDFSLLCREKSYAELLNCVPLYIADKSVPALDFETLYFTTEEKNQCKYVLQLYEEKSAPPFRRTSGLYYRELL
ncbi:MAG: U32 family peptidase [Clostridia bacterium]|nr:U32 family peptidase [Clostridia bacterium]